MGNDVEMISGKLTDYLIIYAILSLCELSVMCKHRISTRISQVGPQIQQNKHVSTTRHQTKHGSKWVWTGVASDERNWTKRRYMKMMLKIDFEDDDDDDDDDDI